MGLSRFSFLIVSLSLVSLSISCHRYRETDTEDRLEIIQQQIDNSQYEESISELNEILMKDPSNDRARTILASVYVRRAGIAIKDYFFLANLLTTDAVVSDPLIDVESVKKLPAQDSKEMKTVLMFLDKINGTASTAEDIAKKFDSITVVSPSAAKDLQISLNELENLKTPTEGMIFYRGVIKLYYFKFLWVNKALLPYGEGRLCSLRLSDLAQKLKIMNSYSVGMILDISKGFPKMSKDFLDKAEEVSHQLIEAQKFILRTDNRAQSVKQLLSSQIKDTDVRNFKCNF